MEKKKLARALAISAALHLVAPGAVGAARIGYPHVRSFFSEQAALVDRWVDRQQIQRERQQLVNQARDDIKRGQFKLGEFMLRANELDSRENGGQLDSKVARERFAEFQSALRNELDSGKSLEYSVPKILNYSLRYLGQSDRNMAEMLEKGGGNCVPTAHLIASLAYDSGYHDIHLRQYPPNNAGISHLAPIISRNGIHYDLRDGDIAVRGGEQYPVTLIPEIYAKRHGLAADTRGIMMMGDGSYPGGAPLMSTKIAGIPRTSLEKAVPGEKRAERPEDTIATWTNWRRLNLYDLLDSSERTSSNPKNSTTGFFFVTVVERNRNEQNIEETVSRAEARVDWTSRTISYVEEASKNLEPINDGGKAIANAYLAGLYGQIEKSLDIAGIDDDLVALRETAREKRQYYRQKGISELDTLYYGRHIDVGFLAGIKILNLENGGRFDTWYLQFLGEKGENALLKIAESGYAETRDWTSLLANPSTHERAAKILRKRSKSEQLQIIAEMEPDQDFHENFWFSKAQVFLREEDGEPYRIYKTIYGLLLFDGNRSFNRYFEGDRGPMGYRSIRRDITFGLKQNGLDKSWEPVFMHYIALQELAIQESYSEEVCGMTDGICREYKRADMDFLRGYMEYRRQNPDPDTAYIERMIMAVLDEQ